VLTVFVVFLGTSTAGATFVKGFRRVTGTLAGIFGGVLLALLVTGNTAAMLMLILLCVFGMVYTARVSQLVMSFFITCMLGLLYSLLGTFTFAVLWVRLAETAVGAAAGLLAAVVVLPVRTRTVLLEDMADVLADLREFLTGAEGLLSGRDNVIVIELSRELDRAVEQVRTTVEPLTHPISVSRRRDYGRYVLTTLDRIAFRARHVAARAEPGLLAGDERAGKLIERMSGNIDILLEALTSRTQRRLVRNEETTITRTSDDPHTRSVLSSLGRLDEGIIALGRALDVEAQSVQPSQPSGEAADGVRDTVRRRTRAAQAQADSITNTSEKPVRRST
jgi:uncharacterized membrane protein YccC